MILGWSLGLFGERVHFPKSTEAKGLPLWLWKLLTPPLSPKMLQSRSRNCAKYTVNDWCLNWQKTQPYLFRVLWACPNLTYLCDRARAACLSWFKQCNLAWTCFFLRLLMLLTACNTQLWSYPVMSMPNCILRVPPWLFRGAGVLFTTGVFCSTISPIFEAKCLLQFFSRENSLVTKVRLFPETQIMYNNQLVVSAK